MRITKTANFEWGPLDGFPLYPTVVVLCLATLSLGSGCTQSTEGGEPGADRDLSRDYRAEVTMYNAHGSVAAIVNGFPVWKTMGSGFNVGGQKIQPSMREALIGGRDTVGIWAQPHLSRRGDQLRVGDMDVSLQVTYDSRGEYPVEGVEITREKMKQAWHEWGGRLEPVWDRLTEKEDRWLASGRADSLFALDSVRVWAQRHPLVVETTFENDLPERFAEVFREAPVLTDTSRLKDYALHLRDLLREGKAQNIYQEIQPSVDEKVGTYQVSPEGPGTQHAIEYIRTEWTPVFATDFSIEDVRVRRWAYGRVWELLVRKEEGLRPFLHAPGTHLKVYVADMNGTLKVVRLTA